MCFCRKILGTTGGCKCKNEDFSAAIASVLLSKGNLCMSSKLFSMHRDWTRVQQSVQGGNIRRCPLAGLYRRSVHTSMSLGDGGSPPYILLPGYLAWVHSPPGLAPCCIYLCDSLYLFLKNWNRVFYRDFLLLNNESDIWVPSYTCSSNF